MRTINLDTIRNGPSLLYNIKDFTPGELMDTIRHNKNLLNNRSNHYFVWPKDLIVYDAQYKYVRSIHEDMTDAYNVQLEYLSDFGTIVPRKSQVKNFKVVDEKIFDVLKLG